MKIINLEPSFFSTKAKKQLKKNFIYTEYKEEREDFAKLINKIKNQDIIISRFKYKFNKKNLSKCKKLKIIISASTGLDHLDLNYLKKKRIKIYSLKGQKKFLNSIKSSSEHTWALLLSLAKNIPSANTSVRNFLWNRYLFLNHNLYKKKIGIVGMGRNGKNIKKYAKAFDMKIFTFDKNDNINKLRNIFKICDFVTLTIELNNRTKHIINQKLFNLVKKKFFLVNTSRAEIINQKDLLKSLKINKNLHFASDFLEFKNGDFTNTSKKIIKLSKNSRILITPHIAGAALESLNRCEEFLVNQLIKNEK